MTKLIKPIKRETAAVFRRLPIIIQLEPPSIIRVKEKGKRIWYETTVEAVYALAARTFAQNKKRMKGEKRNGENI